MSSVSGKAIDTKILRRIYQYLQPYKKVFWMSVGLTVLLALVAPIRPYLIQYTIDNFILADNANGLFTMVMIMFGLLAFQTIIQYYHTVLTNWLGQSAILDLRKLVFSHLLSLRLKYFDNTPIGTLVTRAVSDLETIADVFSEGLIVIIGDILQIVVIVGVMMYIDWRLTLISLATMLNTSGF